MNLTSVPGCAKPDPSAIAPPEELASVNEKLHQSDERFRLVVESVKDYAIFMLSTEGQILTWNRGAEKIKGYRADEIVGKHFSVFYTPEDVARGKPAANLAMAVAEGQCEDEGWRVRKDGSQFWADVVITAWRDTSGNLGGFSKVTRDFTERKRAEDAVRELPARVLRAQDEERRRVARELHDGIAQTLSAVGINLALLRDSAELTTSPVAAAALADATRLTAEAVREVRTLSYLLHPPMLDDIGLDSALRWLVTGFGERTGIDVGLTLAPELARLPREVETALFRVAQECLNNVYRHSGSPTAEVRLSLDPAQVTLDVRDRGKGMLLGSGLAATMAGAGLRGMSERLHQLGGRLEIVPLETGMTVHAVLPLTVPQKASADPEAGRAERLRSTRPAASAGG